MVRRALILGGAACLWDDLKALGPWDGLVIAVNDAGCVYPHRIDHWASLHPEKLENWKAERAIRKRNGDYTTWTHLGKKDHAERAITGWTSGSSGMLAVGVALEHLHCDQVVLCGVPMDAQPHFFDPRPWQACETHRKSWVDRMEKMEGKVCSMSGWTRELLGSPQDIGVELLGEAAEAA